MLTGIYPFMIIVNCHVIEMELTHKSRPINRINWEAIIVALLAKLPERAIIANSTTI